MEICVCIHCILYMNWNIGTKLPLNCKEMLKFFCFFFVLNFGEDFYAAFWLKICLDQDCAKTGKSTQPLDRLFKMKKCKSCSFTIYSLPVRTIWHVQNVLWQVRPRHCMWEEPVAKLWTWKRRQVQLLFILAIVTSLHISTRVTYIVCPYVGLAGFP